MKAIIRIPWDSGCYVMLSVASISHTWLLDFQKSPFGSYSYEKLLERAQILTSEDSN